MMYLKTRGITSETEKPPAHLATAEQREVSSGEKLVTMRLKFSSRVRERILTRAKAAGMNASQWITAATRQGTIVPRLSVQDMEHLRTLAELATTLHELAELSLKSGFTETKTKVEAQLTQVERLMERIGEP
ncbi:MAG TPA: hypothetical protein H9825_10710 [Candidatus Sphingobacterium stercorigallinarum]|nr:hypothetical protein [Candidatus Sphingobacterium stercorigallinarum]